MSWPGRLPIRGLVAYRVGNTGLRFELRGGVNLGAPLVGEEALRLAPSFGLFVSFDPLFKPTVQGTK